MLKGDLSTTSLATVMLDLASSSSTGSLILTKTGGEEAQIYLRSGLVCGISAPDHHSDLGAKLVSSGILAPEALSDALEAQRTDLSAWNLGELLVHLGYVEEDVVHQFVLEQLHEALWDLMRWSDGRWKFRKNAKTREDAEPLSVVELLETLRERGYEWEEISSVVNSPEAIPVLSARGDGAPETTLDSDAWSMLCKIDGIRSVAELATDCGYTLFEAGQVLVTLVDAGLVDVNDDIEDDDADIYGASALASALAGRGRTGSEEATSEPDGDDDALTRLARLASDVTSRGSTTTTTTNPLQLDVMAAQLSGGPNLTVPVRRNGETFAASMDRVSGALADVLGPPPDDVDEAASLIEVRKRPKPSKTPPTPGGEQELERRRRLRAAASAELADAQAAAESLRPDHNVNAPIELRDAPLKLVDLETERSRVAAREAEEAARHAAEDTARKAAEKFAKAATEQAARHAAELAEQQNTDDATQAAEAGRLVAEQQAQDAAAEQAREAAEQAAAEAARLAAEQQAQDAAAEQAREAAEQAAAEAARLAAEQQAQAAAEEAARVAAEQAAAAQAAAAQAAADQAVAEQAARESAERAAAESREAAERAEASTALVAAQAQVAAAEEAQRLALEAQRQADEQAAVAAKYAEIENQNVAVAAANADQAAAASAMLAELHHTASDETPEPAVAVVPDPEPVRDPDPEPQAAPVGEAADTAALLRELSSLGLDDDGPSLASAAPRSPRPNHVDPKKAKKKIGLFGL